MLSKNDIKSIKALSQKKFRDESGLFVVEGEKLVGELLKSGFKVERVVRIEEEGEEVMSRITMLTNPSPVLAVAHKPEMTEAGIDCSELNLALDGLRDPGNVGTIIRIADWFGIRNVVASEDTVDIFNPKVVQATMGAIFRVKFTYCSLPDLLKRAECPVWGTYMNGENIYEANLESRGVVVMGSEASGISEEVGRHVTGRLAIPAFNQGVNSCESLNVAIATAITCSEFRRR